MIDVNRVPVAWREAGQGEVLLFLHGLGLTRTSWDSQLRDLSDRWRCVAWDMPGYGMSSPVELLTFGAIADAAANLLDVLEVERAHVCGLSFGGQQALHFTLGHPDRVASLTLADTSASFGADGTDPDAWLEARLAPLDAGLTPADFAQEVLCSVAGPEFGGDPLAAAVASFSRITSAGLRAACECLLTHDVSGRLGEITAPTLVIVGELDEETPLAYSRFLADHISSAELVVIDGVGHLSPCEAPEAFNAAVRRFLVDAGTVRP